MARRAFAFMPADADERMRFAVRDGQGWSVVDDVRLGRDDLLTLFLPGVDVSLLSAPLPARSEAEALRAAPFAVEDDLGEPVEATHAALGPKAIDAERLICVASRERMAAWLDILRARDLDGVAELVAPQSIIPEGPLVADCPGGVIVSDGTRRFCIDPDLPDDLMQALAPQDAEVFGDALSSRLGVQPAENGWASADDALVQLAEWREASPHPIDLRQGAFTRRRRVDMSDFHRWRVGAALAASALVGFLLVNFLEMRALDAESARLRSEASAAYAAAFPSDPRPGDPAAAIRRRRAVGGADVGLDFLVATAALYEASDALEGATIQSLRYSAVDRALIASIAYADYGDDSGLKAAIETAGLSVRIGDARQVGGRVVGDVRVEPAR